VRAQTPLGLFSLLWAAAAALHHLEARPWAGLPIYPFVILLLLFPGRLWAIAAFALAHATLLALDLPSAANHSVLALLMDGLLLIGCAHAAAAGGDSSSRPARLWSALRGPVRATTAAVYSFAIFHKLNSSFFDPEVSCATRQLAKIFELHGIDAWTPGASWLALNIPITLAAEIGVLLLLLWPRATHLGALLGLAFHTGLAWASFFDFATVVFAMYLFFFSWESLEERLQAVPRWAWPCFLCAFAALAATSVYFHGIRGDATLIAGRRWSLQADTLICAFWMLMIWPLLLPLFRRREKPRLDRRWTGARAAWAIPAIAVVNGATPYLGLKTVANYSMFSNLRTEGGVTNHLIVQARGFAVASYQDDLARVAFLVRTPPASWPWWVRIRGGERWVRRSSRWVSELPDARVPFTEVRRTLQLWKEIGFTEVAISYERAGRSRMVPDAFGDADLMEPLPLWERRLLAFRAVDEDGLASSCRW
jgi:hypothetical protein